MFSRQCHDFVFLGVDSDVREQIGQSLRARIKECAGGELSGLALARPDSAEDWDAINHAIEWLLPQVDRALEGAGLPASDRCQLRQTLFATSSAKAITVEAVCRVLKVEVEDLAK